MELVEPDFYRMGYIRHVRAYGVEFREGPDGIGVYSAKNIPCLEKPRVRNCTNSSSSICVKVEVYSFAAFQVCYSWVGSTLRNIGFLKDRLEADVNMSQEFRHDLDGLRPPGFQMTLNFDYGLSMHFG